MRIFSGTTGLNNKIDPIRHRFNPDTGITELTAAINIDIDDNGGIDMRLGQTRLQTGIYHSAYCNGGDCFVIKDNVSEDLLYKVNTDYSLTGVRSGLTRGNRVSFWQDGDKTYYMNGVQSGVIETAISTSWPGYEHVGVEDSREFYPAPIGTHIAIFDGMMWIVDGNVIWVSEVYAYGKFRLSARGYQFNSDVKMIKPVAGGVWVSDSTQIGFIAKGEKFDANSWKHRASVPAHEWSENIQLVDLSRTIFQVPGMSAVWSCDDGLCIGSEDGNLIIATEDKLIYPTGGTAATVVDKHVAINCVDAA